MSSYYDIGLVCLNGHAVNSCSRRFPQHNAQHCPKCGQATTDTCPSCSTAVRGEYHVEGVFGASHWSPPAFCHQCGTAYPWTDRKAKALADAIAEVDELSEAEREKLKQSIPDLLANTPDSPTAATRFKKAIAKTGQISRKLLYDVLTKVATEAVMKSITG